MKKMQFSTLLGKKTGILVGIAVAVLLVLLNTFTAIPERLELTMLDLHFRLKNPYQPEAIQEGVVEVERNPRLSQDIVIIGVDFQTLNELGQWPFPRAVHADLVNSFSRISDQNRRESSIFIDIFFIEPATAPYNDALLIDSMYESGRVYLETVLEYTQPPTRTIGQELYRRHYTLFDTVGTIQDIEGNIDRMPSNFGLQPPLIPYAAAVRGYGHANYYEDYDSVFRRQALVAKSSKYLGEILFEELDTEFQLDSSANERLVWFDTSGADHTVEYPVTEESLARLRADLEREGVPIGAAESSNEQGSYRLRIYQDHVIPAVTLSLALEYFHRDYSDLEIVLGSHITLPEPRVFDRTSGELVPYKVQTQPAEYGSEGELIREAQYRDIPEITIPIDERGEMLINFMGPRSGAGRDEYQTFPVRSYSGYIRRVPGLDPTAWPVTRGVENKILMVGAFAPGMAADEKLTPYGLMYGIEMHANALNTILMDNFLEYAPRSVDIAVLFALAIATGYLTAHIATIWAFVLSLGGLAVYFFVVTILFDTRAYILNYSSPAIAVLVTAVAVVIYRVMTEERDKRRIREMFGKYVSPDVVSEILDNPPELGGVDRELTVFFSDIRGFTTLSESMSPQELVNHLNIYLTRMTDIILEYKGTLDKYVGDEIMCFWGAPLPEEDHAMLSCKCGLRQMEALAELNEGWPPEKRIDIGIGINSGIMTVGNMGSAGRMNYTLMGDNVNLAARLEGTNKEYQTHVLISEYTYGLVADRVTARELDNIRVKGKNKPVVIYELLDVNEGLDSPKLR
ncbi:MAG: CHASE2 domain-containing protein [Spirochaetia bacterium]